MRSHPGKEYTGIWETVARGLAFALGSFALLNLGGTLFFTNFDQNIWWIDFRPLPRVLGYLLLACTAPLLLAYGARPFGSRARRLATVAAVAGLLVVSMWNVLGFYGLLLAGAIDTMVPVPLSLLVAGALVFLLVPLVHVDSGGLPPRNGMTAIWITIAVIVLAIAFPLAQMFCFGKTDYRRRADAAVVFGAGVWPGGVPSHALRDRVNTGCRLYRAGLVRKLLFSGGPSEPEGNLHETEVMRRLALENGVRPEDIILDPRGINTRATVANTVPLFEQLGLERVLAVSHFYHLPRVKMTYGRASVEVYTVPAEEEHVLIKLPYYLMREVAALWAYYLLPSARE